MDDYEKAERPLFEGVDCVHMRVADLEEGLAFYRDALGLKLLWRTEKACGLGMETGATELVISQEDYLMVDFKVEDVAAAIRAFAAAGGAVIEEPFEIDIGKCAVVADPWENQFCLLDTSKGTYDTDADGRVSGVS